MRSRINMAVMAAAVAAAVTPVWAHHAMLSVFDVTRTITVTGTITEVEWINPHSFISLDARGDKGTVQHWTFELSGVAALRSAGLSVEDRGLKAGSLLTVEGIAAKDGTTTGFVYKLRFEDGRVFALANKTP